MTVLKFSPEQMSREEIVLLARADVAGTAAAGTADTDPNKRRASFVGVVVVTYCHGAEICRRHGAMQLYKIIEQPVGDKNVALVFLEDDVGIRILFHEMKISAPVPEDIRLENIVTTPPPSASFQHGNPSI